MKTKLADNESCPKPGKKFELMCGEQCKRCKLISMPGVEVGEDRDTDKALAQLRKKLDRRGLMPEDGELMAFALAYPKMKERVGVALADGPVMFRCAMSGRLMSFYVDDELKKILLWLVVCRE